jgi:hypothetical protein
MKSLNNALFEKRRDKYVLTEIYDLSKDLNFKIADEIKIIVPTTDMNI